MPGSYSVSDIFRYFIPGMIIVMLAGVTNSDVNNSIKELPPVIIIIFAFIIGVLFYVTYRAIYAFINWVVWRAKNRDKKLKMIDDDLVSLKVLVSNEKYMFLKNSVVSLMHLSYMIAIIFLLYVVISNSYFKKIWNMNFPEIIYGRELLIALFFFGVIALSYAIKSDVWIRGIDKIKKNEYLNNKTNS